MLHRFGHGYESELDDAQEELSTEVLQVVDSLCVGTPSLQGIHGESDLVFSPKNE